MRNENDTVLGANSDIINSNENMDSLDHSYSQEVHNNQKQIQNALKGLICPNCGAVNESEATYCASCGSTLSSSLCPYCGFEIDADVDFCESCHHYIKSGICSFCGSHMSENDAYCQECGAPRGGIVCPVCHTLNEFSFCKKCGTPLTEDAKAAEDLLKKDKNFIELLKISEEYIDLDNCIPYITEEDRQREKSNAEFRKRVLSLLQEDDGNANPHILPKVSKRMDEEEFKQLKDYKSMQIAILLEKFQVPQMLSSAKARNYAMATKPVGLRLGWICNYKNALHTSPCGCGKPQLGGKWVLLNGKNENVLIEDIK
jgi:predicted amidophosphoribosyltransferase